MTQEQMMAKIEDLEKRLGSAEILSFLSMRLLIPTVQFMKNERSQEESAHDMDIILTVSHDVLNQTKSIQSAA